VSLRRSFEEVGRANRRHHRRLAGLTEEQRAAIEG
jgi:hypothetical protein